MISSFYSLQLMQETASAANCKAHVSLLSIFLVIRWTMKEGQKMLASIFASDETFRRLAFQQLFTMDVIHHFRQNTEHMVCKISRLLI
jgi:hypothetical protein